MLEWVLARDRQAHVLLTKSDKLNRSDALRVLKETKAACSDTAVTAQLFSAHAKQGLDEARDGHGSLAGALALKKGPGGALSSHRGRPTRHGDDKPGLPAQGEERGASFTLIRIRWGRLHESSSHRAAIFRNCIARSGPGHRLQKPEIALINLR